MMTSVGCHSLIHWLIFFIPIECILTHSIHHCERGYVIVSEKEGDISVALHRIHL